MSEDCIKHCFVIISSVIILIILTGAGCKNTASNTVSKNCNADYRMSEIADIELVNVKRNESSMMLQIAGISKEGKRLALNGYATVMIDMTLAGFPISSHEVYNKKYPILPEEVIADCLSKEIVIRFEDMKTEQYEKAIEMGDPGRMQVVFTTPQGERYFEKFFNGFSMFKNNTNATD